MKYKYILRTLKKGNAKKFVISFVIIITLIYLLFILITKTIEPTLLTLCQVKAKSIAIQVTNEVINETLKDVKYDNLVTVKKDENGRIIALDANVMEMNKISTIISMEIQKELQKIETSSVKLNIGSFTGSNILSALGPSITIKIIPAGFVKSDFKSEFLSAGINQTSHKIYLEVKSNVRIVAPFVSKSSEFVNNVVVAETILIGDVPNTYLNITGLENLPKGDKVK